MELQVGEEIIQPDEIVEEESQLETVKTYVRTYEASKSEDYYPERPVTQDSKILTFDIPATPEYVFRPNEITLFLRTKITQVDGTAHRTAAHIGNGQINAQPAVRFKNTAFMGDIIKKVEVLPNMTGDIQQMSDTTGVVEEKLNIGYLMTYEEREAHTFWLNQSFDQKLHRGADNAKVGFTSAVADDTENIRKIRLLELRARDWYTYLVKLTGPFFSIPSEIPGGLIFRIKIHLADAAKAIFGRQSALDGIGVALDIANNANHNPKFVIDPENTRVRVRYKKSYNYAKEEAEFFASRNMKIECVRDWFIGTGLTFEQRRRAQAIKEKKFTGIENRLSEKFFAGFLQASDLESGEFLIENAAFRPFNIQEWNLKINGHYIFEKPVQWQNAGVAAPAVRRFLWESQLDALCHPEDMVGRRYGPLAETPLDLANGRWLLYLNLSTEQNNFLDKIGTNFAGTIELETQFTIGTQPGANVPDIVFVIGCVDRKKYHVVDPNTNKWTHKSSYGESLTTPTQLYNYRYKAEKDFM